MRRDMLRRVRWGNLTVACGALLCVGAVAAWPRLGPTAPRLPPDTAKPLAAGGAGGPTGIGPERLAGGGRAGERGTAGEGRTAGRESGETRTGRVRGGDGRSSGAGRSDGAAGRPGSGPGRAQRGEARPPRELHGDRRRRPLHRNARPAPIEPAVPQPTATSRAGDRPAPVATGAPRPPPPTSVRPPKPGRAPVHRCPGSPARGRGAGGEFGFERCG